MAGKKKGKGLQKSKKLESTKTLIVRSGSGNAPRFSGN
jgi:hypothetical protein